MARDPLHSSPSTPQRRVGPRIPARHLHASTPQPWFVPVGLACAGLYLGTRYILRAQERVRRQREGLPVDDDDDDVSEGHLRAAPRASRRFEQLLGLDLGSSSLRLATVPLATGERMKFVRIIESADGSREIPAAVAVDNDSVTVGAVARALLGRKPGHTALAARLLLGRRPGEDAELDAFAKNLPFEITPRDEAFEMALDGKAFTPEWAAEVMLDHLHSMAASSLGEDLQEELPAIVSVPAGLTDAQYELYERVAESAGFYVVSTVAEPVAAVHAAEMWAIEESGSGKPLSSGGVVAVFDMGGYTSSISFVQKKPKKTGYVLLGSQSSTRISGRLIDDQLFRLAVDKFREQHGIDLSIDFMASYRILEAVEAAKKELSTRRSTDVNLPFITADATGAKHLVQTLTSFDIDRAYEQPTEEAVALCNRALKVAHLKKSDVSALLVVGGGARAEFLRKELEIFFTQAAFTAKDFRPEEAVVVGAAEFGRRLVESGEAL